MSHLQDNAKIAFLGMPGYGEMSAGAARGFFKASATPGRVHNCYKEGSLLAANFNGLWATALTMQMRGEQVDYFAMLHSDIEPEDGWLDKLIEEMESKGLDILGAAVPIKDSKGLTSLALGREDGDTWSPLCRLTLQEVHQLPETFTSADVGHPLLLNTGCWVCKFNPEWNTKVHFTINDRIVFDKSTQSYCAQVEPEDWYFSRLLHELKLNVGATRKVHLMHRGSTHFAASYPWGRQTYDSAYVPESVLAKGKLFPAEVDGWLLPREGEALRELSVSKRVLEIGSYCGKSTICIAQSALEVVSVDYHDGRGTPCPQETLGPMKANLQRYGVAEKVTHVHPDSVIPLPQFDLAFIDGAHDYDAVQADILKALQVLKPEGLLVFHDYRESPNEHDGRWDPDVTRSVQELISAGAELVSTHATLAVVKPPVHILSEV